MANDFLIRLREWQEKGWRVEHSKGGHFKLLHPDAKTPVFCACTPSDYRAILNIESELRRALGEERIKKETIPVSKLKPNVKIASNRFVMWQKTNEELGIQPILQTKKILSAFDKANPRLRCNVWQLCYLRLRLDDRELSTIHAIKRRLRKDDVFFQSTLANYNQCGVSEINKIRMILIERTKEKNNLMISFPAIQKNNLSQKA
jgi:hypothetical protein